MLKGCSQAAAQVAHLCDNFRVAVYSGLSSFAGILTAEDVYRRIQLETKKYVCITVPSLSEMQVTEVLLSHSSFSH